ncbi:MAG: magnesium transporter CorA family protein [Deltaproteobacteria bacterium]|jgi:magnesium transporter|nr:magnesium transporter CorA family protein [Deltaproteobacteria bacterium]
MLKTYKFTENGYTPAPPEEAEFFALTKPDRHEIAALAASMEIPPHFLSDPLDSKERPRVEQEGPYTLVIIRVPVLRETGLERAPAKVRARRQSQSTASLGIILARDKVITVSYREAMVHCLLNRPARKPLPKDPVSLAFKLFIESSVDFISQLERLESLTDRAELNLSRAQQNEEIMTLLAIDKLLIHYSVALKSNRNIMEKLLDPQVIQLGPGEAAHLERALTENQQAIYMADIFGQVLGSMSDAFGTIISNNLNKVVKFLTGVTIILMLPTFIVGVYGMNTRLPLAGHAHAFWLVILFCLVSCAALWLVFRLKKWL